MTCDGIYDKVEPNRKMLGIIQMHMERLDVVGALTNSCNSILL